MKLSFLPADLHLHEGTDGVFIVTLAGQQVFAARSAKSALRRYESLRKELASRFPRHETTAEEKAASLRREIADRLVEHNSFRAPKKKKRSGSTRTFG